MIHTTRQGTAMFFVVVVLCVCLFVFFFVFSLLVLSISAMFPWQRGKTKVGAKVTGDKSRFQSTKYKD